MTVGSREDLFAQAKHIDDTERLIGRVLAGEWVSLSRVLSTLCSANWVSEIVRNWVHVVLIICPSSWSHFYHQFRLRLPSRRNTCAFYGVFCILCASSAVVELINPNFHRANQQAAKWESIETRHSIDSKHISCHTHTLQQKGILV